MDTNPLCADSGPIDSRCADCVWHFVGGRGPAVDRCRRHQDQRVNPTWPGCAAHTTVLDCQACAACCREAYHTVEVSRRDPFAKRHRALLQEDGGRLNLPRPGGQCICLQEPQHGSYTCTVYADRPRTCTDFEIGGKNCLDARLRLGETP